MTKRKPLTEEALRKMIADGMSIAQISDKTGWTITALYHTCAVLGLGLPGRANGKPDYVSTLTANMRGGMSLREASEACGVSYITAYQYLKRNGMLMKRGALAIK